MPAPGAVNSRFPAAKLPGGVSSVQVAVGNPLASASQISTSKSSVFSASTIRLVSTHPPVLVPVLAAVLNNCAWSLPLVLAHVIAALPGVADEDARGLRLRRR